MSWANDCIDEIRHELDEFAEMSDVLNGSIHELDQCVEELTETNRDDEKSSVHEQLSMTPTQDRGLDSSSAHQVSPRISPSMRDGAIDTLLGVRNRLLLLHERHFAQSPESADVDKKASSAKEG